MQPFRTWDLCNGPQHVTSESCLKGAPGDCSLHDEVPGDKDENFSVTEFTEPESGEDCRQSVMDNVDCLPDQGVNVTSQTDHFSVSDCDPDSHCYNLRPRLAPRITSGWSTNRWTNTYHYDTHDLT